MKQPEPQPKMPREKRVLFLGLLAVAFVILFGLLLANAFDPDKRTNAIVGVMMTMFIVSSVELIPEFVRWLADRSRRGKFRRFFGDMVFKEDVRLVFSHRDLNVAGRTNNPFVTHFEPPKQNGTIPLPEGINGWLAFQDVQAAVYVTNTFAKMTGRQVRASHDKYLETDEKHFCIVSFGLGFNAFTHDMAGYFDPVLFGVEMGVSPKDGSYTDNFTVNGQPPVIPAGCDVAIVARIVPPPEPELANRVWFVCAGRTAAGTAAAGYFLAKKWEQICDLYQANNKDHCRDSIVVVIQHREYKAGPSGGSYVSTADFLREGNKPDGKPVVHWGVAAGVG